MKPGTRMPGRRSKARAGERRRAARSAAVLAAMLLLAACQWGAPSRSLTDGETTHETESVVILDSSLSGGLFMREKLTVEFEEGLRTGQNLLRVHVNLRNRTLAQLQIQVQTIFKDAEWNYIGEKADWKLYRLKPGETLSYIVTSTTEKPERYTVRIRSFE